LGALRWLKFIPSFVKISEIVLNLKWKHSYILKCTRVPVFVFHARELKELNA